MEQRRMERLAVLLDMTPAQKQQVQAIFSAERTRMQQAMRQAREARRAAHTEAVTKLGQVLSPRQMKKLELLMPKRHHRLFMMRMAMRGRMGMWRPHAGYGMWPPPPAPPPAPAPSGAGSQ
jgi:Spy/CpxP family protein refolding chaperone